MARRGSHWGSFGKGFMDAFLAAYRLSMMQDLYANRDRHWRAQEQYWDRIGLAKGAKQRDLDEQIRRGINDPNFHPDQGGGAGGGESAYAGPDDVKDYVTQSAEARGIDPKVALNFVQGESSGNTGAKGDDGSSFGLFQLHYGGVSSVPALSHPGLGDAFTAATGLDARDASTWKQQVDFALDRARVGGWGDWANTQKKYGYDRFAGIDRNAPTKTAKADTSATATATKKPPPAMSPSGGATVNYKGKTYDTDKDGNIKPDTGRPIQSSQADTLPPSNQVASLDDDEAMRIALEQQRQAADAKTGMVRDPNQQVGDRASAGFPPQAQPMAGPNPLYPPSTSYPQSQGGIPPRPALGGGPGNTLEAPTGTPTPPIALGGGRGNELETPTGTPAAPIALGGGPGNALEAPTGVTRAPPAPIDPYEATRNIIPARPYTPTPTGGAAEVTRPVEGGDERLQPAGANAPAANAQPVSAVTPQSNQQAIPANPRFVQIDQPNIARMGNARGGREGEGNAPQMGVPNLSWGPNPPLDQRQAQSDGPTPYGPNIPRLNPSGNLVLNQPGQPERSVPVPMPPPRPSDSSDMVGTPDMASLPDNSFDVTAARKGGPIRPAIPRYAAGGNVTRFAAGGAPATMAQLTSPSYVGPTVSGGWVGTPYSQLAPNQQAWADQQSALTAQITAGGPGELTAAGQLTMMPDAIWPTAAAPAAPAPLNEPAPSVTAVSTPTLTSTANNAANGGTTTGAYQLPDIVAPATTPTVNKPSTTYNTAPKMPSTLVPNAPGGNASDIGGTNFNKPATNLNTGAYAGFKRGGAIPRQATLTRFAAAGSVTPQQEQAALTSALYGANAPYSQAQVMAGSPTMTVPQMEAADVAAMTPEQQTWYNAQVAALNGYTGATTAAGASYTAPTGERGGQAPTVNQGQLTLAQNQQAMYQGEFNPNEPAAQAAAAAAASTPAASAPAPAIPPTVTAVSRPVLTSTLSNAANGGTTTGAYQLPNTVAPAPAPTTTYNPTPKIPTTLVSNTPNTGASDIGATDTSKKPSTGGDASMNTGAYAGFRRGGVTRRVTGYDDGGGVSPAPAGMLPGMSGGQAVPPIYYNPATYAGAGAPVGKGVTNTSAPTYVAGAIPSLPMARGGIVRYDDGGDVQQPDPNIGMDQADQVALNDYDPGDARIEQDIASRSAAENAPAQPTEPGMPAFTGYFLPPQDQPAPAPAPTQGGGAQGGAQEDPHRPPGLLPYAAQGSDPNGNPSNGFISALTGGIHWLADHLGVIGGAQAGQQALAPDPQTQQNRQVYTSRANMITSANREQLNDMADPHHTLDQFMRNINGLEQGWRWLVAQGDITGANKMAASVLQYDVANANNYQEEAAKRYYDGDLPGAVKALNAAADAVPADQRFQATLEKDSSGNPIIKISGSDLTGRELWQRYAMPAAILGAVNPSMPWTMLENQAARYDPTFKQMATERAAAAKERYGDQQAAAAAQKFAPPRPAVTPQSNAPAPAPAPAMPSVPPPPTITADTTTTPPVTGGRAPVVTPPPTADNSSGVTPGGDTGAAMAALPPQPTRGPIGGSDTGSALAAQSAPDANAPAAGAAAVSAQTPDFDKIAASLDQQANVRHQQVALETQQRFQSQYEDYPDPSLVRNKADLTAFNTRREEVKAHNDAVDKAKGEYFTARNKDVSDDVAAQRARLLAQETDARAAAGREATDTRAEAGRKATDERADKSRTAGYEHEEQRPLPYTEGEKVEGVKTIASLPRNAVYNNGVLDENASAQNTAKAYDLGSPATGGLQRLNLIGDATRNIQTWNTHIGVNQVGDLVDGLARKIYSIDPNPQTVDHGYGPMYQVNVYRGPRGSTHPTVLLVPQDDFDTISNIRAEFAAAATKSPTNTGTAPPAQAPAIPPPPVPLGQTTVRPVVPLVTSTPGKPNAPGSVTPLRLPERVPVEQIPPEQRQLYPELNQ
jgi:hypothetical protein